MGLNATIEINMLFRTTIILFILKPSVCKKWHSAWNVKKKSVLGRSKKWTKIKFINVKKCHVFRPHCAIYMSKLFSIDSNDWTKTKICNKQRYVIFQKTFLLWRGKYKKNNKFVDEEGSSLRTKMILRHFLTLHGLT